MPLKLISERHWIHAGGYWACPVFSNWSETGTVVRSSAGFVSLLLLLLQPGNHEHASDCEEASPLVNKVWLQTVETAVCSVCGDTSVTFPSYRPALTKGFHLFPLWNFTGKPPQSESNVSHLFKLWQLVIFSPPKHHRIVCLSPPAIKWGKGTTSH